MKQNITFSIVTDGLGTFLRNAIKDIFCVKLNKESSRVRNKKDGAMST